MGLDRRSVLSALGCFLPFGLRARAAVPATPPAAAPLMLRFRSFEEAVREAFAGAAPAFARTRPRWPTARGTSLV